MAAVAFYNRIFPQAALFCLIALTLGFLLAQPASAQPYCDCCDCVTHQANHAATQADINAYFTQKRVMPQSGLEWWMSNDLFDMIVEAWQDEMSQQTTKTATRTQLGATTADGVVSTRFGLEAGEETADIARRLLPSDGTCSAGTAVEFLAETEEHARETGAAAAAAVGERQALQTGTPQAAGEGWEKESRFRRCLEKYCDLEDHGGNVTAAVDALEARDSSFAVLADGERRVNADIDYGAAFAMPMTLDVDFNNQDEGAYEDMLTMASYLYGHDQFFNLVPARIDSSLFDVRSLQAQRSVISNSFLAQLELKAKSKDPMSPEMVAAYQNIGFSGAALNSLVGQNPSYHAQMDVVMRRLYQDPNFYINLVDTQENLDGLSTAMDAFANMQWRDLYQSLQRQELLYAVLLELKLQGNQTGQTQRVLNSGSSPEPTT